MSSRHAFRRLDIPPQSWPAPGTARVGTNPPEPHAYATASRPKQQACHQPACGAGRSLIRLAGSGAELPEILKQEPDTTRRPPHSDTAQQPRQGDHRTATTAQRPPHSDHRTATTAQRPPHSDHRKATTTSATAKRPLTKPDSPAAPP